jgi:hypothetical protein
MTDNADAGVKSPGGEWRMSGPGFLGPSSR